MLQFKFNKGGNITEANIKVLSMVRVEHQKNNDSKDRIPQYKQVNMLAHSDAKMYLIVTCRATNIFSEIDK